MSIFKDFHIKEAPLFTGIARGVGGFAFGVRKIITSLTNAISIITDGLILNLDAGNASSYYPRLRSDGNSSSLVLAVPMNGANNGTTFTDESANIKGSGSAKTITNNGSIPTLTVQSKFYGSSAYISNAATQSLTFGNYGTDFQFTGDFTIECWVYPTTSGATDGSIFVLQSGGTFFAFNFDPGTQFNIYNNSGSPSWSPSVSSVITGQWNHLAFVRSGSTQQIFVNGVSIGTNTASGTLGYASADFARIGGGASGALNSYIQDFRVYKGVAKYTANFTPPSITSGVTVAAASDALPILGTIDPYGTVNSSGNGNTWIDISPIPTATGALPIYNTTDSGADKLSGTRTDVNALVAPAGYQNVTGVGETPANVFDLNVNSFSQGGVNAALTWAGNINLGTGKYYIIVQAWGGPSQGPIGGVTLTVGGVDYTTDYSTLRGTNTDILGQTIGQGGTPSGEQRRSNLTPLGSGALTSITLSAVGVDLEIIFTQ